MDKFLEGPDAKRAKVSLFREIVGFSVAETVALDCVNASRGDLERAINLYYNEMGSAANPIALDDTAEEAPRPAPQSRLEECLIIGCINCSGSLTTKLSAASNEFYMDTMLNCTFSMKPPTSLHPNTPPELVDVVHGSGFVRFSLPKNKSEIGRLPAPLAAAICPLVLLGLAEVSLAVGFPGCAGLNMSPGASVPVRVEVALTQKALNQDRTHTSGADDFMAEKIHSWWTTVLVAMNYSVNQTAIGGKVDEAAVKAVIEPELLGSTITRDEEVTEEMSEEMAKLCSEYAKPDLPKMYPPADIFPTQLKTYQAQALFWMASREYPKEMDVNGLPGSIRSACRFQGEEVQALELLEGQAAIPPSWTELNTGHHTIYYKEGFFQLNRPPPQVDCRGGILGDEMGLGKTVMTLSLIALDLLIDKQRTLLPSSNQTLRGGTLVVLHLSLLKQWVGELKRHSPTLTFSEFHGADRSFDPKSLSSVNVVFSTYGTVAVNSDSGQSPLLQIQWRRIVLDEAHTIRTRSTKMAKAVARLQAERRWCLTGTPLQNSIEDIYPLVAWLRIYPWRSYAYFKKSIVSKLESPTTAQEGLLNAQAMLKPLMIRRTKATRGPDGNILVELPPRRNKIVHIEMSAEEKDFYRALFWKTKLEFDKFEKSNAVMFNITHVLQLVVRLRQALCHPILCRSALASPDFAEPQTNGVESLDDLLEKFVTKSASKEYLTNAIEDLKRTGISNLECPICLTEPCQFPIMTPCGHTMCRKCVMSRLRGECPMCRTVFVNGDIQNINHLTQDAASPGDEECPPMSSKLRALLDYLARDLKKGRRVIVFSQFVSFMHIISKVFSSKKIPHKMLHGALSMSQRESAIDWLNNADLAGEDKAWIDELAEHAVEVSDNEEENDTPIDQKSQGRVLLVSLKAGGVGLNLVAANVVYLTDLWWNPATEEQAFQRVHRLGQTKKTLTYKFVCHDTIDDRILDLQATKSDMTTDVLGDNQVSAGVPRSGDRSRKLTLEDIRQLFKPQQGSFLI